MAVGPLRRPAPRRSAGDARHADLPLRGGHAAPDRRGAVGRSAADRRPEARHAGRHGALPRPLLRHDPVGTRRAVAWRSPRRKHALCTAHAGEAGGDRRYRALAHRMTPSSHRLSEIAIAVIGGGIVGSSLGGFRGGAGAGVVVIDAGYAGGTTANAGSLHVQMQSVFLERYPHLVPRLESMLFLYKLAAAYWQEFQRELGVDCEVKVAGGLMIAEDQRQLDFLARKAKRETALGLDVAILGRAELDRIAPYLGPAVIGAEFCAHEGKVNPLLANAAIRRWAGAKGALRLGQEAVLSLAREGTGFRITTARRTLKAGKVVLAAGYGSKPLAAQLGFDLPAAPDPLHMNITEGTASFITHLVQHADRPITIKQLGGGQAVIGGGWPAELRAAGEIPMTRL